MEVKNVSYSMLLSHTFPGVLLELEIILAIKLFSPPDALFKLSLLKHADMSYIVSFIALFFIFATILGFILDGVHHFIFNRIEEQSEGITKYITSLEQMQIARALLDDDYWYPYEAFANIWLAMMPGTILLPLWMSSLHFHIGVIVVTTGIYLIVALIMLSVAFSTLKLYVETENDLIHAFKNSCKENGGSR